MVMMGGMAVPVHDGLRYDHFSSICYIVQDDMSSNVISDTQLWERNEPGIFLVDVSLQTGFRPPPGNTKVFQWHIIPSSQYACLNPRQFQVNQPGLAALKINYSHR